MSHSCFASETVSSLSCTPLITFSSRWILTSLLRDSVVFFFSFFFQSDSLSSASAPHPLPAAQPTSPFPGITLCAQPGVVQLSLAGPYPTQMFAASTECYHDPLRCQQTQLEQQQQKPLCAISNQWALSLGRKEQRMASLPHQQEYIERMSTLDSDLFVWKKSRPMLESNLLLLK